MAHTHRTRSCVGVHWCSARFGTRSAVQMAFGSGMALSELIFQELIHIKTNAKPICHCVWRVLVRLRSDSHIWCPTAIPRSRPSMLSSLLFSGAIPLWYLNHLERADPEWCLTRSGLKSVQLECSGLGPDWMCVGGASHYILVFFMVGTNLELNWSRKELVRFAPKR